MSEDHAALIAAVKKMHAAKGRHHTQIATAELYKLVGLPYVMPGDPPPPMRDERHVRASRPTNWGEIAEAVGYVILVVTACVWILR